LEGLSGLFFEVASALPYPSFLLGGEAEA
jgi:hypothetical protein